MKATRKKQLDLGDELIAAIHDTNHRIDHGQPLTVRDISFADVLKRCGPKEIQGIRLQLGCSQGAFAAFLGVPLVTLSSWERGKRTPSAMALRFLHEIKSDPRYWRERLAKSLRIAG